MVGQETMLMAVERLGGRRAAGHSGVPAALAKDASEFISQQLMVVFNASLRLGAFPDFWGLAKVGPIFKTGTKNTIKKITGQFRCYLSFQN